MARGAEREDRQKLFSNGERYFGSMRGEQRWGRGKNHFPVGTVYNGQWVRDRRCGFGKYLWACGSYYIGDWKDDRITGKGIFVDPQNNMTYEGEFVGGLLHGQGISVERGQRYEGQFDKHDPHGRGQTHYSNGDSYEGEYANGQKFGSGLYRFATTGDVYGGIWRSDQLLGPGELRFAQGGVARGEFVSKDAPRVAPPFPFCRSDAVKHNDLFFHVRYIDDHRCSAEMQLADGSRWTGIVEPLRESNHPPRRDSIEWINFVRQRWKLFNHSETFECVPKRE